MTEKNKSIVKKEGAYFLESYVKESLPVICKSNCKLCNSKVRKQVETKYAETNNFKAAANLAKELGEDIEYAAIWRHLTHHFVAQNKILALEDYAQDVQKIISRVATRRQKIKERIAILERRMYAVELATEGQPLDEMRRSADALKKITDTITTHEIEIDKMDHRGEPINLLITNFQEIMKEELKGAGTETKEALMRVFNTLIQSTGEILIDKE